MAHATSLKLELPQMLEDLERVRGPIELPAGLERSESGVASGALVHITADDKLDSALRRLLRLRRRWLRRWWLCRWWQLRLLLLLGRDLWLQLRRVRAPWWDRGSSGSASWLCR